MATRTQIQIDVVRGCIHEQICQTVYEQQRKRIEALCQWMTPDALEAHQLAFMVFVEAWRHAGHAWPAVSGDRLAESFAARFRCLFHSDSPSGDSPSNDSPGNDAPSVALPAGAAPSLRPQLVSRNRSAEPARAAVNALPSAHRLLYLLHELEGYPAATLAAWLDLDAADCAQMIHQARLQLRRRLMAA